MKKIALLFSLGFCLMAAQCTQESVDAQVAAVQAQAKKVCGFVPTATSVAQMIAAAASGAAPGGVILVSGASGIANAICAAITKSSAQALVGSCPASVNGICVEGEFTPKESGK